jgi:hypothetical protein
MPNGTDPARRVAAQFNNGMKSTRLTSIGSLSCGNFPSLKYFQWWGIGARLMPTVIRVG